MSIHQHMEAFNQPFPYRFSTEAAGVLEAVYRQARGLLGDLLPRRVADLSHLFTKGRASLGTPYLNQPALTAAYLAYFLPVNFAKVQLLLDELPQDWAQTAPSVLDVGAGVGTASLAVGDWLRRQTAPTSASLHVTALDHSQSALQEAVRLWMLYCRRTGADRFSLVTSVRGIEGLAATKGSETLDGAPYDLILVANCLNELCLAFSEPEEARALLLERLLGMLKPAGALVVLEPALRSTARALHRTRDLLLERRACTVYSPCLHERACPALVKEDDWCHEERAWDPPAWIEELDRELGFVKDALKFSYVILRKDGRTIVPRRPHLYRVVSELRILKGEKRAWLCNEDGRLEVGRLDRKTTSANAALDAWQRGAIVEINQIVRKTREGKNASLGRIPEVGAVSIIRDP